MAASLGEVAFLAVSGFGLSEFPQLRSVQRAAYWRRGGHSRNPVQHRRKDHRRRSAPGGRAGGGGVGGVTVRAPYGYAQQIYMEGEP